MNYWLFKSEPSSWSWTDQLKKGAKGEGWDGVRNYQASNNMKKMKIGEKGFFYHSDNTKKFGMVRVKALKSLPTPVTLAMLKSNKSLSDFQMIKQNRLSVVPVTKQEWETICEMANLKNI